MSGNVQHMTGHVKTKNLSAHELSRLARFKQMAEEQLLNLGAAIEDARIEKGLSRSALGRKIPVEAKTVERWEKGQTGGAMDSLTPIADALDTTADLLLAAAAAKSRKASPNGASPLDALSKTDLPAEVSAAVEALRLELVATQKLCCRNKRLPSPTRNRLAGSGSLHGHQGVSQVGRLVAGRFSGHRHLQHRERRHTLQLRPTHPSHPCGARSRISQIDQTARLRPVRPLAPAHPLHRGQVSWLSSRFVKPMRTHSDPFGRIAERFSLTGRNRARRRGTASGSAAPNPKEARCTGSCSSFRWSSRRRLFS
jgi:transcriptional regulator with XRE-family HTH domain